jgi:hypothetical protein
VYAGGRFTSISGVRRSRIAALASRTLRPTSWNPGANGDVQALRATPAGLLVYGEFDELGGIQNRGLGVFPLLAATTRNTSERRRMRRSARLSNRPRHRPRVRSRPIVIAAVRAIQGRRGRFEVHAHGVNGA